MYFIMYYVGAGEMSDDIFKFTDDVFNNIKKEIDNHCKNIEQINGDVLKFLLKLLNIPMPDEATGHTEITKTKNIATQPAKAMCRSMSDDIRDIGDIGDISDNIYNPYDD